MKFNKYLKHINIVIQILLIIFTLTFSKQEFCPNSCSACQNTLYFQKFRGTINCKFSQCPDLCLSISSKWNSNQNTILNYFKNDQINICETCFRGGYCHINDCILEKTLVHHAIDQSIAGHDFHYLNENNNFFLKINKHSDEYFFNMDFVLKNLSKIEKMLYKYSFLYKNSIKVKNFYKKIVTFLAKKNKLSVEDLKLGMDIDIDEEFNIDEISRSLTGLNDYFVRAKANKIHLNENKLYISSEIIKNEDIINGILDFNNKIIKLVDKTRTVAQVIKKNIEKNLVNIGKLVNVVNKINTGFYKKEKINIIKTKAKTKSKETVNLIKPKRKSTKLNTNQKNELIKEQGDHQDLSNGHHQSQNNINLSDSINLNNNANSNSNNHSLNQHNTNIDNDTSNAPTKHNLDHYLKKDKSKEESQQDKQEEKSGDEISNNVKHVFNDKSSFRVENELDKHEKINVIKPKKTDDIHKENDDKIMLIPFRKSSFKHEDHHSSDLLDEMEEEDEADGAEVEEIPHDFPKSQNFPSLRKSSTTLPLPPISNVDHHYNHNSIIDTPIPVSHNLINLPINNSQQISPHSNFNQHNMIRNQGVNIIPPPKEVFHHEVIKKDPPNLDNRGMKNSNIFKPDPKIDNLAKHLLGINPKPTPSYNKIVISPTDVINHNTVKRNIVNVPNSNHIPSIHPSLPNSPNQITSIHPSLLNSPNQIPSTHPSFPNSPNQITSTHPSFPNSELLKALPKDNQPIIINSNELKKSASHINANEVKEITSKLIEPKPESSQNLLIKQQDNKSEVHLKKIQNHKMNNRKSNNELKKASLDVWDNLEDVDDDDTDFDDEDDSDLNDLKRSNKNFIQKHERISDKQINEIDFSKTNYNFHRKDLKEIKSIAKNFIGELSKQIGTQKDNSVFSDMDNHKKDKTVISLEDDLSSLNKEFVEIKNTLILNLLE